MAFIGIDNLTHVKDKLQSNIIMGPAYYSEDELKRMAIKVITGIEFKDTATIFNRKAFWRLTSCGTTTPLMRTTSRRSPSS